MSPLPDTHFIFLDKQGKRQPRLCRPNRYAWNHFAAYYPGPDYVDWLGRNGSSETLSAFRNGMEDNYWIGKPRFQIKGSSPP